MNARCKLQYLGPLGEPRDGPRRAKGAIGVRVTCRRCGHHQSHRGTGEASIRMCLAKLAGSCPEVGVANHVVRAGTRTFESECCP